jgi:signal transduction histidine kinase
VALLAIAVDGIVSAVWGAPQIVSWFVAWVCALFALAVWSGPRGFAAGVAAVAIVDGVAIAGPGTTLDQGLTFGLATLVALLVARRALWDREERIRAVERERDLRVREAVADERARIARELHDMVAHSVSTIVLQAGAERHVLSDEAQTTRNVLTTIEEVGRQALVELRRLLGMMRTEGESTLAPQPDLERLEPLVQQVRDSGLPVELHIEGERRRLAAGLELSAYRIVQEALTNSLKHAGDAHARVTLRYGAHSLEIEIADDGSPGEHANGAGGGHGLVGMRERVALHGGRLEAGRGDGGGFIVRALLPIT